MGEGIEAGKVYFAGSFTCEAEQKRFRCFFTFDEVRSGNSQKESNMEEIVDQLKQLIKRHGVSRVDIHMALTALDQQGAWPKPKPKVEPPLCWKCGNHLKV